ncbi:MAG: homoserine dehydrogenase [Anaerolineales bacterium]
MNSSGKEYRLALLGFGNVGQAFARLLLEKEKTLQEEKGIAFQVVGIATGSHGRAVHPGGIDLTEALSIHQAGGSLEPLSKSRVEDSLAFIRDVPADVLFESTPVNYQNGQPALDYLHAALENDMHVITANKGPVVHGYRELSGLARAHQRSFLFEATVLDGAPVFSMARCGLPAADITGFQGILNSTTNLILTRMERGESLKDAVAHAQSMGIAETDPSGDLDGWDAAVKLAILVNVIMDLPLTLEKVKRTGIRGIHPRDIKKAKEDGKRWKLVCSAQRPREGSQKVAAEVRPQVVGPSSALYHVSGTSTILQVESDILGSFALLEENPTPRTTAYGFLADFLNAVEG